MSTPPGSLGLLNYHCFSPFIYTPSQDRALLIPPSGVYTDCTFGHNEHPSALEQISWEVPLDAVSFGLKAAEKTVRSQACQSVSRQLYRCSCGHRTAEPWSNHTIIKISTFAAISRTFFPKAAGTTLMAVYLRVKKHRFSIRDHHKAANPLQRRED